MRCPKCGTYHPSQYQYCVSCGQEFYIEEEFLETASSDQESDGAVAPSDPSRSGYEPEPVAKVHYDAARKSADYNKDYGKDFGKDFGDFGKEFENPGDKRRSRSKNLNLRSGIPMTGGVLFGIVTVMIFAGATIFFLTKSPEEDRLLGKGLKELDNGQYAFAVDTLTKAASTSKDNAKIQLALARAYVGVDQVDKAWDCITKAQQMGKGIVEDPELASQLANYYRTRSKYEKACELLRPLAQKNVPGKKAELADLDALWGDQELRDGKLEHALSLWEEVKDLKEGSRFSEADARLSTIYQRLAEKLIAQKKDREALVYIGKLNAIADNARFYEMAADIYDRTGQLELAIDQLRKASRFSTRDDGVKRKLAALLAKRGKELLDKGELDAGYGYLQQAKSVDPNNTVPTVTLKAVTVDVQNGMPHIAGQVWNPTDAPINALTMKVELVDSKSSDKVMWTKETAVVDEYVPPLSPKEGKHIDLTGGASVRGDGTHQFKVYFDGKLYNTYPIGKKVIEKSDVVKVAKPDPSPAPARNSAPANNANSNNNSSAAAPVPGASTVPPVAPAPKTTPSAEEKTMKELE